MGVERPIRGAVVILAAVVMQARHCSWLRSSLPPTHSIYTDLETGKERGRRTQRQAKGRRRDGCAGGKCTVQLSSGRRQRCALLCIATIVTTKFRKTDVAHARLSGRKSTSRHDMALGGLVPLARTNPGSR